MSAARFRWLTARTWLALVLYWLTSMIGATLAGPHNEGGVIILVMLVMVGICVFHPREATPWWKKAIALPIAWVAQPILSLVGFPLALFARVELADRLIGFVGALPVVLFAMRHCTYFVVPENDATTPLGTSEA